jgi:hypothetical protein
MLVICHVHSCHNTRNLRAEWSQIGMQVGIIGCLPGSSARPRIPIACDRKEEAGCKNKNHRRYNPGRQAPGRRCCRNLHPLGLLLAVLAVSKATVHLHLEKSHNR